MVQHAGLESLARLALEEVHDTARRMGGVAPHPDHAIPGPYRRRTAQSGANFMRYALKRNHRAGAERNGAAHLRKLACDPVALAAREIQRRRQATARGRGNADL